MAADSIQLLIGIGQILAVAVIPIIVGFGGLNTKIEKLNVMRSLTYFLH